MRQKPAHILALADCHGGSVFGMWPKGYRHSDGEHVLTPFQTWLGDCFDSMVESLPKLDGVVLNGDTLDGKNPYSGGRFCITPEPADQAGGMIAKLSALRKKCRWMRFVDGTDCHDDNAGGALDFMGSELKADKWAPGGHYSGQVLSFEWRGKTFNFSHHTPPGMLYAASRISKTHMMAAVAEVDNNLPHADLISTAHIHHSIGGWASGGRYVCTQAAFAGPTDFAIKKFGVQQAYALLTVGAVLITIDEYGLTPRLIRFPLPPMEVEKIA